MTEVESYETYRKHLAGCVECKPGDGALCKLGKQLHDAWRALAGTQGAK